MTKESEELKSCPFCGSKDITKNLSVGLVWIIGCNSCGCRTREHSYRIDAVNAWNRRIAVQEDTACGGEPKGILPDQQDPSPVSEVIADMIARGYPDDDCDENHMSMPIPIEDTPF